MPTLKEKGVWPGSFVDQNLAPNAYLLVSEERQRRRNAPVAPSLPVQCTVIFWPFLGSWPLPGLVTVFSTPMIERVCVRGNGER